jgi:hypothetical protein
MSQNRAAVHKLVRGPSVSFLVQNPLILLRRESPMIVHLFAQCWNDEWMLPFFFRHYDSWVDHYFIYDDRSTDGSLSLLKDHRNVTISPFERTTGESFVLSEQALSNECWKQSRGKADWVIVTDIDEHLFHPDGRDYLARCRSEHITLIPALGYQMISENPPTPEQTLCRTYTVGAPWVQMMKPSIFNPEAVTDMNFSHGRHTASPTGRIKIPQSDEMLLFHYKYMGLEHTHLRHQQLRTGLGQQDLQQGWGHKYLWSIEELRTDWKKVADVAIDTAAICHEAAKHYPIRPWWEKYRS